MNEMTMAIVILVGSFAFMLMCGVEIAYSLGLSAVFTCLFMGIDLLVVFQSIFYKMSNYSLLAVPCFVMATFPMATRRFRSFVPSRKRNSRSVCI